MNNLIVTNFNASLQKNVIDPGHTEDWKCQCKPIATRDGKYVTVFHK